MNLYAHITAKISEVVKHAVYYFYIVFSLVIAQKLFHYNQKFHALNFFSFIDFTNVVSFISCLIWGPLKIPAIGIEPYLLPLCKSTHFKLLFELSINSRQSVGEYSSTPMFIVSSLTSLQNTRLFSCQKKGSKSFSLLRYVGRILVISWHIQIYHKVYFVHRFN